MAKHAIYRKNNSEKLAEKTRKYNKKNYDKIKKAKYQKEGPKNHCLSLLQI